MPQYPISEFDIVRAIMKAYKFGISLLVAAISSLQYAHSYGTSPSRSRPQNEVGRRSFLATTVLSFGGTVASGASSAQAATFTPGGTMVDRAVGVTVSNSEASSSRAVDNTNVLFPQDYYFKFGVAAPWIDESNREEFPLKMPFTPSQQRYEGMKKYGERVTSALKVVYDLNKEIDSNNYASIPDANSPLFALRALGLFANTFCASENTGTTNELFLVRWYVNEIFLAIGDIRTAPNQEAALRSYNSAIKAANSYLNMLNRVITPKVGDKFELLKL
jgi:hypothetical protein